MTERVVIMRIEGCLECPWLEVREGYASSLYRCPFIGEQTREAHWNANDTKNHFALMKSWFENKCTLEKVG